MGRLFISSCLRTDVDEFNRNFEKKRILESKGEKITDN